MLKTVMVPLDTSPFAETALPYAIELVRRSEARLFLMLVHQPPLPPDPAAIPGATLHQQQRQTEEAYLDAVIERLGTEHAMVAQRVLLTGTPAAELATFARRRRADLIVMSTHGHGRLNRLWLGSVADGLVRRSKVPVLLVRPTEQDRRPPLLERRALAAVDGSPASERALVVTAELCRLMDAACTIVRVVVPPAHIIAARIPDTAQLRKEAEQEQSRAAEEYLRTRVPQLTQLPGDTRTEILTGNDVADAILRSAEAENADLIAVGTRGHGRAARLLLGSVSDKVVRGSHVPVLVCPAPRE